MSNEWKNRIIRVGAIAVMAVAAPGCVTTLIGLAVGIPGALHAGGSILAGAACIGVAGLVAVNVPSRNIRRIR